MRNASDWLLVPLYAVVAVIGIGWGGRNTVRSLRNLSPLEITCEDYVAQRPSADWVRLTNCAARERIGIESRYPKYSMGEKVEAVYIPLRPASGDPNQKIVIVLHADTEPLLSLGDSRGASDAASQQAGELLAGPIEGLVERAVDRSERKREDLRAMGLGLANDFVVVSYGSRPRPLWLGLPILGIGLGALSMLVRKWRRRRKPVEMPKAKLVRE